MPTIILCLLSGVGGYILGQKTVAAAPAALGPQATTGYVGAPHGGHGGHGGHGHHGGHGYPVYGGWGGGDGGSDVDINIYNDLSDPDNLPY